MKYRFWIHFIIIFLFINYFTYPQNITWNDLNGYYYGEIRAVAENNKGELFLGTQNKGIFRSTDLGYTWVYFVSGLPEASITNIITTNEDKIYVSTAGSGLFYSTNNGDSWQQLVNEISNLYVNNFIIHKSGNFYAGIIYDNLGSLWCSSNQGISWFRIDSSFEKKNVSAITYNSKGDIFVANYTGLIYKSTDLGKSWTKIKVRNPDMYITSM